MILPGNKFDIDKAKKLSEVSYPVVEPHLKELFVWLQDGNWPVFPFVASFLSSLGLSVVPYIKEILQSDDDIWKWKPFGLTSESASADFHELRQGFSPLNIVSNDERML